MGSFVRIASTVILLFAPIAATTQEIDLAKIKPVIIGAVEELRMALVRSDLSVEEYQSMMEISCNALTELSRDTNFANLLREYEARQYDERLASEIRDIFLSFRSFLEFLMIERDVLLDAGLSEEAVDDLLGQIVRVRKEATGFKLDAEALLTDLRRLAEQACSASETVSGSIERSEMWCNIERFGTFANASGVAGSVMMSGAAMMPQC